MDWDGQNPAREQGKALIHQILEAESLDEAKIAADKLKALSKPFLNWAGKAERLSFDVPTLPLFVHERLSTKSILETLKSHKRDKQMGLFDLFADPQHPLPIRSCARTNIVTSGRIACKKLYASVCHWIRHSTECASARRKL
jgi:hypothetical protein